MAERQPWLPDVCHRQLPAQYLLTCGFSIVFSRRCKHGKRGDAYTQHRRVPHAPGHELVARKLQQNASGVSRAGPLRKRGTSLEGARHAPMRFGAKASQQEKCDALKEKIESTTKTKIETAKIDADNAAEVAELIRCDTKYRTACRTL